MTTASTIRQRWFAGHGPIAHRPETVAGVEVLIARLIVERRVPDEATAYTLLAAADRLSCVAMNVVAHMTYTKRIDLSGVGELNTMSESMAENRMAAGGFAPVNTHRNYLYCCIIASMGTGYPVDFFAGLPLCEAVKLRDAVNSDFFE